MKLLSGSLIHARDKRRTFYYFLLNTCWQILFRRWLNDHAISTPLQGPWTQREAVQWQYSTHVSCRRCVRCFRNVMKKGLCLTEFSPAFSDGTAFLIRQFTSWSASFSRVHAGRTGHMRFVRDKCGENRWAGHIMTCTVKHLIITIVNNC